MNVGVVPTGTANLASVLACLRRLGTEPFAIERPDQIESADRIVLPGVGTFGASMATLRQREYEVPLKDRIEARRPTLCVCVGLQLLFAQSEESPGARGLGIVDDTIHRFPNEVRVPHLGWNRVETGAGMPFAPGYAYFANSFRSVRSPKGWRVATCDYAGEFVASMRSGAVWACQFHPELSGPWGQAVVGSWLEDPAC